MGVNVRITLEQRLNQSSGRVALRLVYWLGSRVEDGKIKHNRRREPLDLFLYATPVDKHQKQHNKNALAMAEAIRAKRIVEAASGAHGFDDPGRSAPLFWPVFDELMESKQSETGKSSHKIWSGCRAQLRKLWPDEGLLLSQIDEAAIARARAFFDKEVLTKTGQQIRKATAAMYFQKLRAVMKRAHDKGLIRRDVLAGAKTIATGDSARVYLSIDEVRHLVATPCRYDVLKRAFLFSCLTGLRWSDVFRLEWSAFGRLDGVGRIAFNQQKTKGLQYLDLTPQAVALMGEPQAGGRVFVGLRYSTNANVELVRWAMAAGISKHVTFHAARHTFAVSLLSQGVDIYTVSRLLGHTQIKTTQIYADIIDEVRRDAVFRIPDIGV